MRLCLPNEEERFLTGKNAGAGATEAPATVLIISPCAEDHEFFSSVFDLPSWKAYRAWSYREALKWLMRDRMTLIICDFHLPDGDWKDVLSQAQVLPEPPCVVLASRLASDALWADVLNLGGFDLLEKPFVREEVIRVAETARNWRREVESSASPSSEQPVRTGSAQGGS